MIRKVMVTMKRLYGVSMGPKEQYLDSTEREKWCGIEHRGLCKGEVIPSCDEGEE